MEIQRPLFWYQGLFLQPQHFQLLDLSFRSLLSPFNHFLQPHFWGIGHLEIQESALGNRSFNLMKGELLFPDGTYTVFPGNSIIEGRSFEQDWVEGGKPFTVYIGIKKWNYSDENVTVLPRLENISQTTTRFVTLTDPEEIKDLHKGEEHTAQVKMLYHALKIFWETEINQLGDYILIPIARLVRIGEGIKLSGDFIPPSLTISGSDKLLKIIKEIRDQISARSHQLEGYKHQRGIHTAEFGSRDMVFLLALRSLNRYVPLLFHYTEAAHIHPWVVYGTLRQLIGELSTFSERINVMGELQDGMPLLPNYDPQNLWECFSSAQNLVTQLIDEITAGPEYIISLAYDGTFYTADLNPAIFEGRNRFYLVLRTETDPNAVVQSLTTIAKISTRENLPILIARALPGIRVEHLPIPPQELPRRANCIYFRIDHHSDQWGLVEKGHNIAIYWDFAPEDLETELMVAGRS